MANEVRIKVIVDDDSAPGVAKAIAEQKALERETKKSQDGIRSAFMDTKQSMLGIALSLSPTLLPLAAGTAAGIGLITASFGAASIAAIGFGAMAKSVLSSASSDSDKLATINTAKQQKIAMLQAQMMDATTKKQKAALQTQIAAVTTASALQYNTVTAGWTKSYGSVVDSLTKIKASWKNTSRDIASPVLLPWLDAVDRGIAFLRPLVQPVASEFQQWGKAVDQYFRSKAGSDNIKSMATSLGQFASIQLADIVQFIRDIGGGFVNLAKDTKGQGVYWGALGDDLVKWGDAFNKWSQSKNARDDVHGFLRYLRENGSQVMSFVEQLAKLMPQLFVGASTIGTAELQAITAFLGFINKLPKSWQAPIVELAGAMLILKKTGVLSVGIKLAKTGGLAGGAEGGVLGRLLGTGKLAWAIRGGAAFAAATILLKVGSIGTKKGQNAFDNPFGADPTAKDPAKQGISTWVGLGHQIERVWNLTWNNTLARSQRGGKDIQDAVSNMGHHVANIFDGARHDVANRWDSTWDAVRNRTGHGVNDVSGWLGNMRNRVANQFDNTRHTMSSAWDTAWNNTVGRARRGVGDVINWINNLPGQIRNVFKNAGSLLTGSGGRIISGLLSGVKSAWGGVAKFFKGIPGAILKFLGINSPPQWAIDAGKHIVNGLHIGMNAGGGTLGSFAKSGGILGGLGAGLSGAVYGSGVRRWSGLVVQVLKMLGEPAGDLGAVLHRMNQESGGNPKAINLTDINAQHGDPSVGLMQTIGATFNAYAGPFRGLGVYNPLANIYAGLNYAKHAYPGRSLASVMLQPGGYAAGGPAQGWIMAGEHGRELIRVPPSSHVSTHGATESMMAAKGSGGHMTIGLAPGTSDSKLMKEIIKQLRVTVFDAGGNVQDVLGWRN